jgi:peptidoglycan/xylan/chitin deacetylase (PgdA/CDA1 family)
VRAARRVGALAQRLPERRPRAVVLVYHRVGERSLDPWRLTVDPEIFAGQMETLARDWSPISLAELVQGFQMRRLPERAVAVTFDDGYADNLEVAAPILLEHAISATLFVATDLIDSGGPLWWDELASLLLEPERLPSTLTLSSGNGDRWRIPPVADEERRSSATTLAPWDAKPGTRLRAFYDVWLALRAFDVPTREAALDEIADWSKVPRPSGRVLLTWEQLREFAALPGFDLGAHTLTHPVLPTCSHERAGAEIAGSADRLRTEAGVEVAQFAYPFGAWSPSIARLVADLGFSAAYTTEGSAISWSASAHALPRVPVEAQSPGDFAKTLADLSCPRPRVELLRRSTAGLYLRPPQVIAARLPAAV